MRNAPARLVLLLCLPLMGAGCANFPELDRIAAEAKLDDRARPELLPLEPLLATAPATRATPEAATDLTARADALRARAAALQAQPVIDDDTRNRMDAGVAQTE